MTLSWLVYAILPKSLGWTIAISLANAVIATEISPLAIIAGSQWINKSKNSEEYPGFVVGPVKSSVADLTNAIFSTSLAPSLIAARAGFPSSLGCASIALKYP